MKNTIVFIFVSLFILSCTSTRYVAEIKYESHMTTGSSPVPSKYFLTLPKGFTMTTLIGGHNESEKQYVYADSIKVYITDFQASPLNYSNIKSLGDTIARKRFEGLELKAKIAHQLGNDFQPETLILQGKTTVNLYWKDIRMGFISIGYLNVPASKKDQFDKVLSSIKKVND